MSGRTKTAPASITDTVRGTLATFGARLADVRTRRGISQKQVTRLTDNAIASSSVSRIEAGQRLDVPLSSILTLCMAYDMDVRLTRQGTITIHGTGLGMEKT